jgi:DNA-binding FrmR family transcriptional regulator
MPKNSSLPKAQALINFKKAHSLLGKIVAMTEENKYCIDIMQQNLAVVGLLKSANQLLMEGHLNTCFKSAMNSTNKTRQKKMTDEILQVARLTNK